MDIQMIIELVTTLGFPIVVCVFLFYYMVKQDDRNRNTIKELSETIQGNTKVLAELYVLIKEKDKWKG